MRLVELIDGAVADAAVRLVVVADEIQPEQLRPLRDAVARTNGRIRLVTVGHCPTPEPARIPALLVGPIEREMAAKVVNGWYPAMPTEHVDFVVRFPERDRLRNHSLGAEGPRGESAVARTRPSQSS